MQASQPMTENNSKANTIKIFDLIPNVNNLLEVVNFKTAMLKITEIIIAAFI
jgi:hypothetical protein